VEYDGTCKLPLIGRVKLAGSTRREAENKLEELYKDQYRDPYITITINNRKVIVFPGSGSNAKIVNFLGDNMNLLEALAEVGGISNTGKAKKVKLIRGDLKNPKIYKIDLSTLEGMKEADLALQSGDIIYVDPYEDPAVLFNKNISPYLAVLGSISSVITTVAIIISLTK
jgi:polysaccharide export outer membrane protein